MKKKSDPNCEHPNQPPPFSYSDGISSLIKTDYNKNHCGYFPLSRNNYWVYLDSLYDNNGIFVKTVIDTLRFTKTYQAPDSIIWWEPNINPGVLRFMYSTDSVCYALGGGDNGGIHLRWFYPIASDSTVEWPHFSHSTFLGKAYKINTTITTPAGNFSDCLFYQKLLFISGNPMDITFKPYIGILKFKHYNYLTTRPYKISTLLAYHLE